MNNAMKKTAVICSIILAAGLAIGGIGYALGGVNGIDKLADKYDWIEGSSGQRMIMGQTVDAFSAVEVTGNADVFMASEDYYRDQSWLNENELLTSTETDSTGEYRIAVVKGSKVPEPEIKVENGVLKIHAKERKGNVSLDFSDLSHTPRILICCPKEELSSVNIHVDTGDIELAGISYKETLVETDTGDIVTAAVRGGKQSIRTDTGDVDLSGSFTESTVVKSDTGDIELTGICTGVIDITSDTGEFSFETKAAFADFGDIELKSDTGDISVEEGDNEIAEIDSAPAHYSRSGEGTKLTVVTDTGDIEVSFGETAN